MRWKSKRWQREWIVSGTLCGCVVARMNTTCDGGSSSVLSSALNAARREHVDLVDDVDLVAAAGGREAHAADDLVAHRVHARVRGGVDLADVRVAALGDLEAVVAGAVGLAGGALLAVERLGEQPRRRGLAGAARPGEQVGVRDRARRQRRCAACALCAAARRRRRRSAAVLPVQGLVRHMWPFDAREFTPGDV